MRNNKRKAKCSQHTEQKEAWKSRAFQVSRVGERKARKKLTSKQKLALSISAFVLSFCTAYIASAEFMAINNSKAGTGASVNLLSGQYYINVSSPGEVNVNLNATAEGAVASANDTITVRTNTPGYKLYLSSEGSTTNSNRLYMNGDTSSSYYLSPTSGNTNTSSGGTTNGLDINSWGVSTNNGSTYSPVPLKGSESLIVTKTGLTAGSDSTNTHTVTYGVKANMSIPAGNYSNSVVYSVVSNASSTTNSATISPTEVDKESSGTFTLTVTIHMMTNMDTGAWTVSITPSSGGTATTCTSPTATKETNDGIITITCSAPKNLAAGTYAVTATNTKYGSYTSTTNLKYKQVFTDLFSITEMQQMTSNICSNTKKPAASATSYDTNGSHRDSDAYIPQWALTDTRDNKKYVIQKMPDGKCWMAQNLALNGGQTLTSEKTNISSDYYLPNTTSFSSTLVADVKTGSHTDGSVTSNGNWYSFQAVTVGNGSGKTGDGDIVTAGDICPKKWRLPNGGSSGEFKALYGYYNNKSKFDAVWHPVYPGFYISSSVSGNGTVGYWWSRTSKSSSLAYSLREDNGGDIYPAGLGNRYNGFLVRCIAQ